jgi:hypothetical protein
MCGCLYHTFNTTILPRREVTIAEEVCLLSSIAPCSLAVVLDVERGWLMAFHHMLVEDIQFMP